jgi:hypothetical protein
VTGGSQNAGKHRGANIESRQAMLGRKNMTNVMGAASVIRPMIHDYFIRDYFAGRTA